MSLLFVAFLFSQQSFVFNAVAHSALCASLDLSGLLSAPAFWHFKGLPSGGFLALTCACTLLLIFQIFFLLSRSSAGCF